MPRYKTAEFEDNTILRLDVGPGKTLGPDGPAWQSSGVTIDDSNVITAKSLSLTAGHGADAITLDSDSATPMGLRSKEFGGGSTVTFSGGVYTLAGRQLANTFTALNTFSATILSIEVAQRIGHQSDADTYMEFTTDKIDFVAGGVSLLSLIESTVDEARIGNGGGSDYLQVTNQGRATFVGPRSGLPYGQISVVENAAPTVIAVAGTAVQVAVFNTNGPANNVTPDHTNNHITVTKAGHYLVLVSATVNSVAGAASRFEISVQKNNGAGMIIPHVDRNVGGGGVESGVISMSGIADLAVNDTVEIWLENETNTQNYVVEDICLYIGQIGGT